MTSMDEHRGAEAADDLLTIGRFARLSGLSIGALRHYDELDLLRPAEVDRFTSYRRYRRDQLETARLIARLRDLDPDRGDPPRPGGRRPRGAATADRRAA